MILFLVSPTLCVFCIVTKLLEVFHRPETLMTIFMICHLLGMSSTCTFAAPTADAEAEAQYLAYGHGLVGGVNAAAQVVPKEKTVEVKAAPVVSYAAGVVNHQVHHVPKVTVQKYTSSHIHTNM